MIIINEQSNIKTNVEKMFYIDPYHLNESSQDADIILITHSYDNHFSIDEILKCKRKGKKR